MRRPPASRGLYALAMPSWTSLKIRLRDRLRVLGASRDWTLIPAAALIGALAGCVAVGFHDLVQLTGRFFFGTLGGTIATRLPGGGGLLLPLLLPAIGGLMVGAIKAVLSNREESLAGVPYVVERLARFHGRMPLRSGILKAITSSITIGSGGSAGVESPIVQIGSVAASQAARLMRVSHEHVHTLVGCGAAAGIAGIFNTPIAGVMFTLEVILRDFSVRTFVPIVLASVMGTAVSQSLTGEFSAVFDAPSELHEIGFRFAELLPYAVLGLLSGWVGVMFVACQRRATSLFHRLPLPAWLHPGAGGLMVGVLGVVFVLAFEPIVPTFEPPAFFANGYPVIEALLHPATYLEPSAVVAAAPHEPAAHATLSLLLAVLAFKLVATSITLGSGGSGGIIAPSLFMGATLGGAVALVFDRLGIIDVPTPASYALVGMAGVAAATLHAPLTSFLLVFELTQDYRLIVPTMLVSILAITVSQAIRRDSIFVEMLRERGIRVGSHADMTLLRRLRVADVPLLPAPPLHPEEPAQRLIDLSSDYATTDFAVIDDEGGYLGMVVGEDVRQTLLQREAVPLLIVGELMRTNLPTVEAEETLDSVLDKFSRHDVSSLVVLEKNHVAGTITRTRLMRRYQAMLAR